MGLEARCLIHFHPSDGDARSGEGAVHLDDAELVARGEARHRVPRATITQVAARGDQLVVRHAGGTTTLALGATAAAKWKARLDAAPKSVVDKLDIKAGHTVSTVGVRDEALLGDVEARAGTLVRGRLARNSDVILLGAHAAADLARIARAVDALADRGALWVLHPRGVPAVGDTAIFAAGEAVGLTATKVARVSELLSGEKLVRRRS